MKKRMPRMDDSQASARAVRERVTLSSTTLSSSSSSLDT